MFGHVVLVEARRQRDGVALLAALGWSDPVARADEVEGVDVGARAQALQDAHPDAPLTVFAVREDDRWTVVSDLDGALTDHASNELAALAAELDARVIALRFGPGECGLAWYERGRLRRRIDQVGADAVGEREPLAVEAMFGQPGRLDESDLIVVMQSLGIDVERLNRAARYLVLAY